MKKNPDLLQVAEVENYGADLTVNVGKTNEEDYNMNISEKEYQKTV